MTSPTATTTSTLNVWAVTAYASWITIGLLHLSGAAKAMALTTMFGPVMAGGWAALIMSFGVIALVGALLAARLNVASPALILEAAGCTGLALTIGLYELSIAHANGFSVLTTQTLAAFPTLGAVGRGIQAWRDVLTIRATVAASEPADPAPLAKPTTTTR